VILALPATGFAQKPIKRNDQGVLDPVPGRADLYSSDADAKSEIDEALQRALDLNLLAAVRL